ncbi:MAG: hypothetical protein N4A49_09185 [Marinifilaceae bacterium]|jgi:hypothetical protein|nr:hypothetical protein [Marinifilaceae bacterium]
MEQQQKINSRDNQVNPNSEQLKANTFRDINLYVAGFCEYLD